MFIAIDIPIEHNTPEKRQAFLQSIYDWGLENLEDQEHWQYFSGFANKNHSNSVSVEFFVENELDCLAIKLTWS